MVRLDHLGARSVVALDVVGKPVIYTRIDVELAYALGEEPSLHRGDERPHQAPPAVTGIDQHIEKGDAALVPGRPRDRESDQSRSVPRRHHHGVAVGDLPAHLTR